MERSRKLVLTDWTKANDALNQYFEGNKSKLAEHVRMSRTTITAFFKQEPVREAEFRKLCLALRLNWQEVSTAQANAPKPENETDSFQQVREHCRQKILSLHSRMRLLSGEEIGVDQLYVDVWLLNRSPRTFQVSQDKLLQTFDLRNDRLGLGDRIKRNPGFEVANTNTKLVILGKPGAGKTTFLKHLAVDWCKGEFQPDRIAVFIELRRIRNKQWNLVDAIGKELELENWEKVEELLKPSTSSSLNEDQKKQIEEFRKQVKAFLKQAKLLILLDGLDEVPTSELRRDLQIQLQDIAENYSRNRLILTCRTQVLESIPISCILVEVAEFNPEQVKQFVQNWFKANGESDAEVLKQWETFNNAVNKNPALKELTVTPILLSLVCLVFQDEGKIPTQVSWLYEKGIKLLLNRWNENKQIDRWELGNKTYRQLSVEQKEAMLIEIAARKFENPENFVLFQQNEIATQIGEFLQLANCRDGVAVLKAMEAQHGLLIERADELWSFSHLTFQEYFTVQWLTQLPSEQLAEKIADPQWRRAIEKVVHSQQPADRLLRLIKQSIDWSISGEPTLNQFLTWAFQKATSIEANYKPVALRAFYFDLDLACPLKLARDADQNFSQELKLALNQDLDLARDFNNVIVRAQSVYRSFDESDDLILDYDRDITLAQHIDRDLALKRTLALDRELVLNRELALDLTLTLTLDLVLRRSLDHKLAPALDRILVRSLERILACQCSPNLASKLEQLRTVLPSSENWHQYQQWWQLERQQWLEQLQQAMIEHRNMGHKWQFNQQQKQQLQRYYDASHFLVKLMQIDGAVSEEVRAEIEDSLLLPWDELQRRYPETYGNS